MEQERDVQGVDELLGEQEQAGTLAVLARAEINQQIATAKAHPRSITKFAREAEQLVTLNEEMARACVYALPRGGKTIEGPSARFAEIIAYSFGNIRYGARPVLEEGEYITSQGVAYDLERNNGVTIEVRRRITNKDGERFNQDMIGVTANAANSIALRNALLKIIPKALWNPLYQKARQTIMGKFETFQNRLAAMFAEFVRYGVSKEMLCAKLGKAGVADIKIEDMVVIGGMLTALQDGDSTPEEMFAGSAEQVQQPRERKETTAEHPLSPEEQAKLDARKKELAAQAAQIERKGSAKTKGKKAIAIDTSAQDQIGPGAPQQAAKQSEITGSDAITPNMLKQIELRIESYGVDEKKLRAKFGVGELKELKKNDVTRVLEWIEQNGTDA